MKGARLLRVAVTRARADNSELVGALRLRGVDTLVTPLIRSEPMDLLPLREALAQALDGRVSYAWAVFTSRRAVEMTWRALADEGTELLPAGTRVCAVGPATAAALRAVGAEVALLPSRFDAEALAALLAAGDDLSGRRVLFPRALDARETIPALLRRHGAQVDELPCYRTVPDPDGAARLREAVEAHGVDAVALASGSAVRSLVDGLGPTLAARVPVATIGPVTTRAARDAGLTVIAQAASARMEDFAAAIATALAAGHSPGADLNDAST